MSRTFAAVCAMALLAGCAATAPRDLVEDGTSASQHVGLVTKVEKKTIRSGIALSPGEVGTMGALGGVVGILLISTVKDAASSMSYYEHEITTAEKAVVTQTSEFEFPAGTCVAVQPDAAYGKRLVRSARC